MAKGISRMQLLALQFAALPFEERPRNFHPRGSTWEALRKKGLVTNAPWRATERGLEFIRAEQEKEA